MFSFAIRYEEENGAFEQIRKVRRVLLALEVMDIYRYWQKHQKVGHALRCHLLFAVTAGMERRPEECLVLLRNPL